MVTVFWKVTGTAILETFRSFALWLFKKECPFNNWFTAGNSCLSFSPWQFLQPTSLNTPWTWSTFSESSYFLFHLIFKYFLISVAACFLSIVIAKSILATPDISHAASFACLSASSLPAISFWTGTQWTSVSVLLFASWLIHSFVCSMISILFLEIELLKAGIVAAWQSVYMWILPFLKSVFSVRCDRNSRTSYCSWGWLLFQQDRTCSTTI